MYHPQTLMELAHGHQTDLLRESGGNRRVERYDRPTSARMNRLLAHPRLLTVAITLLGAVGIASL